MSYTSSPIEKALGHVREHHPEVTLMVVNSDGRWQFMDDDFNAPAFGAGIDVSILEAAADSLPTLPAVFEWKTETNIAPHTPIPWDFAVADNAAYPVCNIFSNDGEDIILRTISSTEEDQANAEHVVKCVNHYDALVAALRDLLFSFNAFREEYPNDIFNEPDTSGFVHAEKAAALLAELEGEVV
jgi:hypothetical protein